MNVRGDTLQINLFIAEVKRGTWETKEVVMAVIVTGVVCWPDDGSGHGGRYSSQ